MDLAAVVDLVTTVGLIGGLVFAGVEWRASRRERRRESQMTILRSFESPEFVKAMRLIMDLPAGLSRDELDVRLDGPSIDLVWYWFGVMETLGVLAFERQVDIRDVDQVYGGPVIVTWGLLRRYAEDTRARSGRESMHEWFQWLAEHVELLEREEGRSAAHIRERDWRP